jgi:hypothetical protein
VRGRWRMTREVLPSRWGRWSRGLIPAVWALACGDLAGPGSPRAPAASAATISAEAPVSNGASQPGESEPGSSEARQVSALIVPAPPPGPFVSPDHEQADLDAGNDLLVAPPPPVDDCSGRLARAHISFSPAALRFTKQKVTSRQGRAEVVACGAEQVVAYLGGPAKIRYNGAPTLTCRMALALARFEQLAQEQAALLLGQRIVSFKHLGTYSCRKMVRFDFVSEHSYANAIDIGEMVLENGEKISVEKSFGALDAPAASRRAEFLRSLARRAFDERLFSTVLTPYWDNLHRDHFHLDLARYRVDGTRPQ